MLQKIIMAIFSVVTMVAGSIVPDGLFADEPPAPAAVDVVEERVTTLAYDGESFARVSVLWVDVDGERLREDAWGQGRIDSLRFKVGVKQADGNALALGERSVSLSPTDILTIRGFDGRFSFSGMGTSDASLQLDGTVENTVVRGGDGADVATRGRTPARSSASADAPTRLAHVVLDTGQSVGTLEVAPGGVQKIQTGAQGAPAPGAPATPLDVRWVKFDGALVDRYTYGDGEMALVEFQPDTRFPTGLNFSDRAMTFREGDRVQVREFLGSWSVVQRPGGGARLRLDGWAGAVDVLSGSAGPNAHAEVAFTYLPATPSTRDVVAFRADADDPDGTVLGHEWTFVRKASEMTGQLSDPANAATVKSGPAVEHRFTRPGTWEVTLRVIDDQGGVATATQDVVVANTPPTAAFDWFPNAPTTLDQVRFFDRSKDLDGSVTARAWDFGDGTTSTEREPVKAWTRDGTYTVTLQVTDGSGATTVSSQIVRVRNALPDCSFELDPPDPASFEDVLLRDTSSDREGALVAWAWKVENLENRSAPVLEYTDAVAHHTFVTAQRHRVSLAVTDAAGESSACARELEVRNLPPVATFSWWPDVPETDRATYLNATASDVDGRIVRYEWNVEGDPTTRFGQRITYPFPRSGPYTVTLRVTDDGGLTTTVAQQVSVANAAPVASFVWSPAAPRTGDPIRFTNTSRDPDGDRQVAWEWDFGPGQDPRTASGGVVFHTFDDNGTYPVTLRVTDSNGREGSITQHLLVLNRPPTADARFEPATPTVLDDITFTATGTDADGDVVAYEWLFGDGATATGSTVQHRFEEPGIFLGKVVATDDDGAQGEYGFTVTVRRAAPVADFEFTPEVGATQRLVAFRDLSDVRGAPVHSWAWTFGDGTGSALQHPTHTYARAGVYTVTLTVTDEDNNRDSTERTIEVTDPPVARFDVSTLSPTSHEPVTFTDTSFDPDGQIVARTWTIDHETVGNAASFSWQFATRGLHPVQLTVVDDKGVASHRFENISVRNLPPVASWTMSPSVPIEGEVVVFDSTSTDADGTLRPEGTVWVVGDTPFQSTPDPMRFEHVFTRSGFHSLALTVEDDAGARTTRREDVAIFGASEIAYGVNFRYSDNTIAPIGGVSALFCSARVADCRTLATGVMTDASQGLLWITLPRGTWLNGDRWDVTLQSAQRTWSFSFSVRGSDALLPQPVIAGTIIIPRELATPLLQVDAGEEAGALGQALVSLGLSPALDLRPILGPTPGVYYASTGEQVTGNVAARWISPAGPASGGRVQVWMNRSVAAEPVLRLPQGDFALPGILSVKTEGLADENGDFPFVLPFMVNGMNPPGWYTVDTVVSWPGALAHIPATRATRHVFVDAQGLVQGLVARSLP